MSNSTWHQSLQVKSGEVLSIEAQIQSSGLFDTDWYLKENPDVAQGGLNPLTHYTWHGASEGREPNPLFDTEWYLAENLIAPHKKISPLAHYLLSGPSRRGSASAQGIAVCAIFKDEAPFIREWIAYHSLIGVDHFFLYDNGSVDGGAQNLGELQAKVTTVPWNFLPGQVRAYKHFIREHGHKFKWAAFIDLDEFITLMQDDSVAELLKRYEEHSLLLLNWRNFGPWGDSGVYDARPPGMMIEKLIYCLPEEDPVHTHVKSIVKLRDAFSVVGPHIISAKGTVCNSAGQLVPATPLQLAPCFENAYISHFYTRSRDDFYAKVARGRADIHNAPSRPIELFEYYVQFARCRNENLSRFALRLQAFDLVGPV